MRILLIASLLLLPAVAFGQSATELWRQGFTVADEYGYVEVEECEPDSPIDLGDGQYFECSSYEYPYHYGAAILATKVVTYKGRGIRLTYLCLEDDECLAGQLAAGMMFKGFRCTADCSGHEAGYEWAESHDIDDPDNCGGRSRSFIEGCIAFAEGR